MKQRNGKHGLLKASYKWHRHIGAWLSIPILLVVCSGIALNHSQLFGLEGSHVTSPLVLALYGMEPESSPVVLREGDLRAAVLDGTLYVNGRRVGEGVEGLTGLGALDSMITVSTERKVFLLDPTTLEVIEKLGAESLPPGKILRSEVGEGGLLLDTDAGRYRATPDVVSFAEDERSALRRSEYSQLSAAEYSELLEDWRGRGISYERLLGDFHSGRLFGRFGVLLVDLCGLLLLFLAASGLYNIWKTR